MLVHAELSILILLMCEADIVGWDESADIIKAFTTLCLRRTEILQIESLL
jgi:hypothetical protein